MIDNLIKKYMDRFMDVNYFTVCDIFNIKIRELMKILDIENFKITYPYRGNGFIILKIYGKQNKIIYRCEKGGDWKKWVYDKNGKLIFNRLEDGRFQNNKSNYRHWYQFKYKKVLSYKTVCINKIYVRKVNKKIL